MVRQAGLPRVMQEKLTQTLHRQNIQGTFTGLHKFCQPSHRLRGTLEQQKQVVNQTHAKNTTQTLLDKEHNLHSIQRAEHTDFIYMESGRSRVWFLLAPCGFFQVESYQWLKYWHSSDYPAKCLALEGQRWDRLARCQYTVTGWETKFDLQLLSQCGSTYTCMSRSISEIHSHVAGTLSNQPSNKLHLHRQLRTV